MTEKVTAIIIDDDSLIRRLVASILETLGCQVIGIGGDGAAAAELYRENNPDIVFLDINMPGVDGLDALRRIFRVDPGAHVVMLTGMTDTVIAENCMTAGAKNYIQKDGGPDALREALAEAIAGVNA